jgi:ADP-heptose:LPS heptosyltransferase
MQNIVELYYQSYKHLHKGDYINGFNLFENRWKKESIATLPIPFKKLTPQPVWKGQPLFNKSITVQMEMGYGDCIQFIRFIPLLKVLGAKHITVLQTKSLHHLFSQIQCINSITNDENSDVATKTDYWVGSMSLSALALQSPSYARSLFPITKTKIVSSEGYLDAKASNIKYKVGVNWSAAQTVLHKIKSISAKEMKELVPEAYSLNPESNEGFIPLPNDGWKENWSLTASHMRAMKAVVTVDTGTAHLAGALGVKCIVLLPEEEHICWRWKNTSWYDSVITLKRHEWSKVPELLNQNLHK